MDKDTRKMLKNIYNNGQMMNVMDRRSPLVNGTREKQESYQYLLQGGFIRVDKSEGMIYTTISGQDYIQNHFWDMLNRYLSIAAIIISILSLLKPPSIDIIGYMLRIMQ